MYVEGYVNVVLIIGIRLLLRSYIEYYFNVTTKTNLGKFLVSTRSYLYKIFESHLSVRYMYVNCFRY